MIQARNTPAYVRIADDIRDHIRQGDPPVGGVLPSEAVLCRQYGVARGTIRQAVAELERQGLVVAEAGKGRRVLGDSSTERVPATQYESIAEDLRQRIKSGDLDSGQALPGEAALAEQFQVSKGTVRQALKLLAAEGLAVAVHGKGWFVESARTRADELTDAIRGALDLGTYEAGSVLPGELALAQEHGVGRVTVRRALEKLEAEGRVEKRAGQGRIVLPRPKGS